MPGFTAPISVTVDGGKCTGLSCPTDILPTCPNSKMQELDAEGNIVGCLSACTANIDGDPSNSANCCSGSYVDRASCPSSGVDYYSYFKAQCENAYAAVSLHLRSRHSRMC